MTWYCVTLTWQYAGVEPAGGVITDVAASTLGSARMSAASSAQVGRAAAFVGGSATIPSSAVRARLVASLPMGYLL